ncbi:MAG: hypothetical protein ACXW31_00435 [Thermoanaerobaculia bacterium]
MKDEGSLLIPHHSSLITHRAHRSSPIHPSSFILHPFEHDQIVVKEAGRESQLVALGLGTGLLHYDLIVLEKG